MSDILLTRIDNRLVHGQVGVAWTSSLAGCNLIVVADDLAAEDEIQQSLMRATAENAGCGTCFHSRPFNRQPVAFLLKPPHCLK